MFLIDDILLAPLKGVIWLGEKINEIAEREVSDEENIKEKLMELRLRFELDEISEEEYDHQEKELIQRLDEIVKMGESR
ncbi:MAG: gas vesicle protein GvpG [Bacteroidota bacterium]|nr:gas vesicle protein GvpG [Bacteroidota bacterium]